VREVVRVFGVPGVLGEPGTLMILREGEFKVRGGI